MGCIVRQLPEAGGIGYVQIEGVVVSGLEHLLGIVRIVGGGNARHTERLLRDVSLFVFTVGIRYRNEKQELSVANVGGEAMGIDRQAFDGFTALGCQEVSLGGICGILYVDGYVFGVGIDQRTACDGCTGLDAHIFAGCQHFHLRYTHVACTAILYIEAEHGTSVSQLHHARTVGHLACINDAIHIHVVAQMIGSVALLCQGSGQGAIKIDVTVLDGTSREKGDYLGKAIGCFSRYGNQCTAMVA